MAFETLEERALLSIAQDLVNQLTPYQSNLSASLDAAVSLPLVGDDLADLPEFDTIFQNSLASINAQTQSITTNGNYQRTVALPALSRSFAFELGLDEFLDFSVAGGVQATVSPTLTVGFNYLNGVTTLDVNTTRLDLGFNLSLPSFQATASLNGLLFTRATDAGTSFQGNLGFDLNAGNALVPQFTGEAHVLMGLTLSFVDPALDPSFNPTFRTTLDLDWGFGANNQLNAPSIQLQHFGLEADGFLDGFLGDIVSTVQEFTKPIQPFVDIFQTPVPILSAFDSSETIGTLMLKAAGSSEAQQESFATMMQIINAVNSIDLSGNTGGAVITFGSITLTGDARQSGGFGFNTSQISGIVDDIFDSAALQEVEDAIRTVGNYSGLTSSGGFKFPLLENPAPVIGAILTGQTETMFEFSTGRQHLEFTPTIGVGIPGILGIFLKAGIVFDANLTMGYDTAGLIAFAADPGNPAHLLHGFYFDNSIDTSIPPASSGPEIRRTGLYLQGLMALQADILLAHVTGGLYADVVVELVSTDSSPHVHLDTMLSNLDSGQPVFDLSGRVYAAATISLELSLPIGPDITFFSFDLAYEELLNFDEPPPSPHVPPYVVIDAVNQRTLLLDATKMQAGQEVRVTPFHDLTVTHNGNTFAADGIRVDYANEIHLFVERKNNFTTNHYNLIGVNGPTPDGVSINVTDPFRVFVDEGAANPYLGPTKPGVLLTGGKNVVYRYNEAADGTKPNVLLAAGFGSNTLTGGTMMFGNFIPVERIGQAKSHFGNTSGYDAAGLGLINSRVDAMLAPVDPGGIIGAKMSGSRGGLMFGGAGNNSFIATGGGVYEMVGGNWLNSFDISPSYNGAPASYQIDGGGGESQLIVRVPPGEIADFENGTVPDRYRPEFKALDVFAKENRLFVTAHGIKRVLAYGAKDSEIILGDTSELDIDFKVSGSGKLKFGGSIAPDNFHVSSHDAVYNFFTFGTHHHRTLSLINASSPSVFSDSMSNATVTPGFLLYSNVRSSVPFYETVYRDGPYYTIERTFGTNGRTQSVRFDVSDARSASVALDGRGASDDYHFAYGLGSFLDITIDDTDETTQNSLELDARLGGFHQHRLTVTDTSLKAEYYTPIWIVITGGLSPTYYYASVGFTPTIYFDTNTNVTFRSTRPFFETIINRPTGPQHLKLYFDAVVTGMVALGFAPMQLAWDPYQPQPRLLNFSTMTRTLEVIANGGSLEIERLEPQDALWLVNIHANTGTILFDNTLVFANGPETFNILGNSGTITLDYLVNGTGQAQNRINGLTHVVNVLANSGTINLHDAIHPLLISNSLETQVNIGDGNLANVSGTINLSHLPILIGPFHSSIAGRYGLRIDDRNNPGVAAPWTISFASTKVGDLTINHQPVNQSFPFADVYSKYQAFTKAGAFVTLIDNPQFNIRELNGGAFPTWQVTGQSTSQFNYDGDAINLPFAISGNPGGTVSWSATGLPPGLSIHPTTGAITGTISPQAYLGHPYQATVLASNGAIARGRTITWLVFSGIAFNFDNLPDVRSNREGDAISVGPISASNRYNLPVSFSASGLPTGLTLNPQTRRITGSIAVGAAQNGPFQVTIHATDGVETGSFSFEWNVTGITLNAPAVLGHHAGQSVNHAISATTVSGLPVVYSATELPTGLSIHATTGQITGVVAAHADPTQYYTLITATQGNDTLTKTVFWNILPIGVNDTLALDNPGNQTSREGESVYLSLNGSSALNLNQVFTFAGLPPGITFQEGEGTALTGYIGPRPATPYNVTATVNNGFETRQVTFQWTIEPIALPGDFDGSGLVDQGDYLVWRDNFGQIVPPFNDGDANGDGLVDTADYTVWRDHLGQVLGSGAASTLVVQSSALEATSLAVPDATRVERAAAMLADLAVEMPRENRLYPSDRARYVAASFRQRDDNLIFAASSARRLREIHQLWEHSLEDVDDDRATAEAFAAFDEKGRLLAL